MRPVQELPFAGCRSRARVPARGRSTIRRVPGRADASHRRSGIDIGLSPPPLGSDAFHGRHCGFRHASCRRRHLRLVQLRIDFQVQAAPGPPRRRVQTASRDACNPVAPSVQILAVEVAGPRTFRAPRPAAGVLAQGPTRSEGRVRGGAAGLAKYLVCLGERSERKVSVSNPGDRDAPCRKDVINGIGQGVPSTGNDTGCVVHPQCRQGGVLGRPHCGKS